MDKKCVFYKRFIFPLSLYTVCFLPHYKPNDGAKALKNEDFLRYNNIEIYSLYTLNRITFL